MLKRLTLLFAAICLVAVSHAQNENDPKFEIHYGEPAAIENEQFKLEISEPHSQMEFVSIKVTITNYTDDWMFFDPEKVTFIKGGTEQFKGKGNAWKIGPKQTKSRGVKAAGEANYHSDSYTVEFNDPIELLPTSAGKTKAESFDLPPAKNSFAAGEFDVKLIECKQKTKETLIIFEVTYTGNQMGLVDGSALTMHPKDQPDKVYATENTRADQDVLKPGKKTKVKGIFHIPAAVTDMQKSDLVIDWNDTFIETSFQTIKLSESFDLKRDDEKTKAKNS
ncbi:MAG: hypothetical protein KDC12_08000 [Flavobacteriales bacterium]|nr:hypothetical protein [Flavobacteriales bacterium]